jgi:hypothetical protein
VYDNVKEETKTRCGKTLVEGMFGGWWEEVDKKEEGKEDGGVLFKVIQCLTRLIIDALSGVARGHVHQQA